LLPLTTDSTTAIANFSSFLIEKLRFHSRHPEFEGNYSIDIYLSLEDSNISFLITKSIVTELFDLQRMLSRLWPSLLTILPDVEAELTDLMGLAMVSMAEELSCLYNIIGFLLLKMHGKRKKEQSEL
jgi:hypothetical protein